VKITRLPLKVNYVSSSDKITSFPGLKLVADVANRLGILSGLGEVGVKKRRRGIPTPDFIMSLVNNFLIGGSHLTDLEALRSEKATRAHLYDLQVPAPTTPRESSSASSPSATSSSWSVSSATVFSKVPSSLAGPKS